MSHREDQHYIIDLCDEVLGLTAAREHTFDFLRGDSRGDTKGRKLPVDAYYEDLMLVVEYHEKQHQPGDSVPLWDYKQTVSGVSRKVQRAIYDQRRRDVLPKHGIRLVELSIDRFAHRGRKLQRHRDADREVIAQLLKGS